MESYETCDDSSKGKGSVKCPSAGACASMSDQCGTYVLAGSAETCDAECVLDGAVTTCTAGDGCCPDGCAFPTDTDCPSICGNGKLDAGETCDDSIRRGKKAPCPTACEPTGDACAPLVLTGDPAYCDVECVPSLIDQCVSGDGCCPTGCLQAVIRPIRRLATTATPARSATNAPTGSASARR